MVGAHEAIAQKDEELHACVQGRVIGAAAVRSTRVYLVSSSTLPTIQSPFSQFRRPDELILPSDPLLIVALAVAAPVGPLTYSCRWPLQLARGRHDHEIHYIFDCTAIMTISRHWDPPPSPLRASCARPPIRRADRYRRYRTHAIDQCAEHVRARADPRLSPPLSIGSR